MLIFTDLDGTLFDTDINSSKNILMWIEEFSNAKPKKNAKKIIEDLHNDGHLIIALTSRGVDLGEIGNDIHKITCASVKKNFASNISGIQSSVRYKYHAIVNILNRFHFMENYKLESDVILIDDDIEQITLGVLGGIKSILFNPPKDFNKDFLLEFADEIEDVDKKIENNLKMAKNWDEVYKAIDDWNKSQDIEENNQS